MKLFFLSLILVNRDAFIAFTGSHQLLLFPVFQIQRQIQRKVLGVRFWEKVELRSKEILNAETRNEFNPRKIHNLLRTFQIDDTGTVASGDQSEILRDWYKSNVHQEGVDTIVPREDGEGTGKKQKSLSASMQSTTARSQRWKRVKKSILNRELWRMEKVKLKLKIFPGWDR